MESGREQSDSELERQLLAHDRERLVGVANGIVRDRHEAEDVVQETRTSVWEKLSDIAPEKLTNYLSRAVRLNAIKRRSRRRQFAPLDSLDATETSSTERRSLIDPIDLEEAIGSLPLAQQNVIRMKYYFGMTLHQIGMALSISQHTAASRCRYALAKLQKLLSR